MIEGLSPDAIVNARLKCLDLARSYGGRDEDRLARARAFAAFVLSEAVEVAPPAEVSGAASFGIAAALVVSADALVRDSAK